MGGGNATPLADQWALLEDHFNRHARLVHRYRHIGRAAALHMWRNGTNEIRRTTLPVRASRSHRALLRAVWKLARVAGCRVRSFFS